jgi:hypothetical protein
MLIRRRPVIAAAAVALLGLGIWTYLNLGQDKRMVQIGVYYLGAKGETSQVGAQLPLTGDHDVSLGYLAVTLSARSTGLEIGLKASKHALAYSGDLVFQDGRPSTRIAIDGTEHEISVYDASPDAVAGGKEPLFLGNLKIDAHFRDAD